MLCRLRKKHARYLFSSLNFQDTWFQVMAFLIPKNPDPRGRNESHQLSDHISQALWCIWLLKLRPISWKTLLQTVFIPHRQGAEAVYMIQLCSEMAREWSIPVFVAQLDLKRGFDRISHDSIQENVMSQKPVLLVAVLCSCSLEVRLGQVCFF